VSGLTDDLGSMTVLDAAASLGVELRGEEWYPFHCGQRMRTYSGIVGIDLSRCEVCAAELQRVDSPHVNGGRVLSEDILRELGECVWRPVAGRATDGLFEDWPAREDTR
jgi:hypothetical protein